MRGGSRNSGHLMVPDGRVTSIHSPTRLATWPRMHVPMSNLAASGPTPPHSHRWIPTGLFWLCLSLVALTTTAADEAAAQDVPAPTPTAELAPGATVALLRSAGNNAHRRVERRLVKAVVHLGFKVLDPNQTQAKLPRRAPCRTTSTDRCDLTALRRPLHADAVISFAELPGKRARKQERVLLRSSQVPEALTVATGTKALRKALAQLLGRPIQPALDRDTGQTGRTTIVLSTLPPHARVGVERKTNKDAPARFKVKPGIHRLYGQLPGGSPVVEQVDIPAQDQPFAYQLVLHQGSTVGPTGPVGATRPPLREPSVWNHIMAATLGAATIGLTGYAIWEARRDGECLEESALRSRCIAEADTEVAVIGGAVGASLTGLAALGLLLWEPLEVEVAPDRARLQMHGSF